MATGRHSGVPYADRLCCACDQQVVEDAYHFVFECPDVRRARGMFTILFQESGTGNDPARLRAWASQSPGTLGAFVRYDLHERYLPFSRGV